MLPLASILEHLRKRIMEFPRHNQITGRSEGAQHLQNNSSDVIPISISRKTANHFAASFKKGDCTTPVCGKSVDENSGSCKECYTAYPVDVNRAQDGTTKKADTLNVRLDNKSAFSLMLHECQQATLDAKFTSSYLISGNIGYKQQITKTQFSADPLSSRMVDLQIKEDAKKDTDTKNGGGAKGNNNWRENASTKWLANDVLETSLDDIDMENFIVLENELLCVDSSCRTKQEYLHEDIFDSPSGTEDVNWSFLNSSLLSNDCTKDFPSDLTAYLGAYTGNVKNMHLVASDNIESGTDSPVANETQMKDGQRTDEIRLLTEALRTRSFAPIAYLLSLLTKNSSGFMTGTTSESCMIPRPDLRNSSDDDVSVASSSLSNQSRRFSSQESCDSDHSSVLSDGRFGTRFSESDFTGVFASGKHNSSAAQSIDFLTLETDRIKSDNSNESDVVKAIDDILTSDNACNLQIFQELLERESVERTTNDRHFTKVWKEASTETSRICEASDDDLKDNKQQIAEDQIIVGM